MPAMPIEYEALRVKSQQTLFEFLDVELKLGRTFTHSATLAYNDGHGSLRTGQALRKPGRRFSSELLASGPRS
jgi:hypothetical protein